MTELLLRKKCGEYVKSKKCGEYVKSMSEIRSRTAAGTGDLGEMLGKEKSKRGNSFDGEVKARESLEGKNQIKENYLFICTVSFTA